MTEELLREVIEGIRQSVDILEEAGSVKEAVKDYAFRLEDFTDDERIIRTAFNQISEKHPDAVGEFETFRDEFLPVVQEHRKQHASGSKHKTRRLKKASDLMQKDIPEPRVFVGVGEEVPLLLEGTCILSSKPKMGKSWFALALAIAVAKGEDFIGYKTRKCSVLYYDYESGEATQQKRLRKILHGEPAPENLYIDSMPDKLGGKFEEQLEAYIEQDPDIGVVIVDVFQYIRTKAQNIKESDYNHSYRDFQPLNIIAQKYRLSIILVCHERKAVDVDDPFSNILGSVGLQGAATQMIAMYRVKKDAPIHISVKGKNLDGVIDKDLELNDAVWTVVEGRGDSRAEEIVLLREYEASRIREAVVEIVNHEYIWKGRCGQLITKAAEYGIGIEEAPKTIGVFLHQHVGRFLNRDGVRLEFITNGTGPTIYKIIKTTIDTIDGDIDKSMDKFEKPSVYKASEIPFLKKTTTID